MATPSESAAGDLTAEEQAALEQLGGGQMTLGGLPPTAATVGPGQPTRGDPRGMVPVIRAAASANSVDPDIAVRVAQTEGLGSFPSGIPGEDSWGAFQLHTGGGLGDDFRKETGLNPADPANEVATINWAMQKVRQTGWGPWHGAKNAGISGFMGIDGAGAGGAGGRGGGGTQTAANDGGLHGPPAGSTVTMLASELSPAEQAQLEQLGSGQAYIPAAPNQIPLTPQEVIQKGIGAFVPSTTAGLAVPQGARLLDPLEAQRKGYIPTMGWIDPMAERVFDASQRGYDTYMTGQGPLTVPHPGGPNDPKWAPYKATLDQAAQAPWDVLGYPVVTVDPQTGRQVVHPAGTMSKALWMQYFQHQPGNYAVPGPGAPGGQQPGAPGPQPGAPGPQPGAPGPQPGAPGPQLGADAFTPQVTMRDRGPAQILPPTGGGGQPTVGPGGFVLQPYHQPGYQATIDQEIARDDGDIAKMNTEAKGDQNALALINGLQSTLSKITSSPTSGWRDYVTTALHMFHVPDDMISKWIQDPAAAQYFDKGIMQVIQQQMNGMGANGVGVMSTLADAYPQRNHSLNETIDMMLNAMKLGIYRNRDMRQAANDYFNTARGNYDSSGGTIPYSGLRNFYNAFNDSNPATDYYRAAEAITPRFSDEAWHEAGRPPTYVTPNGAQWDVGSGRLTAAGRRFVRFIPPDERFFDPNGKPQEPQ